MVLSASCNIIDYPSALPEDLETCPTLWSGSDLNISAGELSACLVDMFEAKSQECVWEKGVLVFRKLGFEHLVYAFSLDTNLSSLGAFENYQVLSTLACQGTPPTIGDCVCVRHPVFQWALNNTGVIPWSASAETLGLAKMPEIQRAVVGHNSPYGATKGLCVGFPKDRTRSNAVLSLAASKALEVEQLSLANSKIIYALSLAVHRCLGRFPITTSKPLLTARQREVLEWVSEGKTNADMSKIMGISTTTVEKHLRLAREALEVETTSQAIARAMFLNLLFAHTPPDSD